MRLLVVVFAPPEGRPANAAGQALARVLQGWEVDEWGLAVERLVVPRTYGDAARLVRERLMQDAPDLFLLYDTDPTSEDYKLHNLAANYDNDPAPDASGAVREDQIIDPDAPVAFRTRLPLDGIWDKLLVENVPVRMSHKATHVFNHVYFRAMQTIHDEGLPTLGGAIETPPLPHEAAPRVPNRTLPELEEETVMVLAVLRKLYAAEHHHA